MAGIGFIGNEYYLPKLNFRTKMEYTEEVIKEADSVLKLYTPKDAAGFDTLPRRVSIRLAIQDRKSVLEELGKVFNDAFCNADGGSTIKFINEQIQSLTQQIDYLKSKL